LGFKEFPQVSRNGSFLGGDMNFLWNGFFPMVKMRWDSLGRHWWWGRYKDMEVAKKWEVWTK
jgi:hypothetical protein